MFFYFLEENISKESNVTSTCCSIAQLLKGIGGGHSLCKVLKHFSDGRVWIEIGGHELLLMQNGNLSSEKLEEDKEVNFYIFI